MVLFDNAAWSGGTGTGNSPGNGDVAKKCYVKDAGAQVVDPWGKVLSDSGFKDKVLIKEIDLQQVSLARTSIPSLKHTRKI